jgi:5'-nucleotidase
LAALERELETIGEVYVVAPQFEQSGVGHSITYLSPLICKEVFEGKQRRGWAVEGSPADCVKIGIFEFCPRRPDVVISGINSGLNAGINVLYSGTVAILANKGDAPQLYNLNIPTVALANSRPEVHVVPMGLSRWGEQYEKRIDPRGRPYFWATGDKPPALPHEGETDLLALKKGHLTLTPLHFDLTQRAVLERMREWRFELDQDEQQAVAD